MNNTNLRSLTGIRGVAALFVVIYHFTNAKPIFFWNGYLAVDLFFILSGFIMSMVYQEKVSNGITVDLYIKFLYHRFARIYPLYFVVLVFTLAFYITGNVNNLSLTVNILLLQSLFGGSLVGASWSVSVELIAYVIFPIVFYILLKNKHLSVPLLLACYFGIFSLPYINQLHSTGPLDIYNGLLPIFRGVFGFMIGCSVWVIINNIQCRLLSSSWFGDLIMLFIIFILFYKGFDLIYVALCAILIACLYKGRGITQYVLSTKPLFFIGEISFSIYLTHLVFKRMFEGELSAIALKITDGYIYSPTILMLACTIATSVVTYYLIERPCRIFLRKSERFILG